VCEGSGFRTDSYGPPSARGAPTAAALPHSTAEAIDCATKSITTTSGTGASSGRAPSFTRRQGTPLVYDGVMYMPNPNDVMQAPDVATGEIFLSPLRTGHLRRPQPSPAVPPPRGLRISR